MDESDDRKKSHRKSQSGRKAEKKKSKNAKFEENVDPKIRNPKAFTFNSVQKAERKFRRSKDLETKKDRVPQVDRIPIEPPPFIVAIVGAPKVGKSTLFQNLVKNFTRQKLTEIKGPVTIISGKKKRLTFIECNNDINSMIDVAKIADLVLLLVDASFGFEMEIFEFLNICQVHGFPQIMGVLTHLDLFRNKDKLKKTKKTLKHRFWTEVYPGSKLFYLSGFHPGTQSYPKNEIHNLARFVSVMKFRPTVWRSEHAYIVADRIEDITSLEDVRQNPTIDRNLCFYGYVHGTFLNPNVSVHIPGLGDYATLTLTALPDPCPLPLKEKVLRRSLNEKEKLIYAPFSGVGGIIYDKDAVYIDMGKNSKRKEMNLLMQQKNKMNNDLDEQNNIDPLMGELRNLKTTLSKKLESSGLQLFSNSEAITGAEFIDDTKIQQDDQDDNENDSENEMDNNQSDNTNTKEDKYKMEIVNTTDGRARRKVLFEDENFDKNLDNDNDNDGEESSSSDDENENETENDKYEKMTQKMKKQRIEQAEEDFYSRFRNRPMQSLIYDDDAAFETANINELESKNANDNDEMKDFFIGGDYASKAKLLLDADDDDEMFGDFEELDELDGGKDMDLNGEKADGDGDDKDKDKNKGSTVDVKREEMKKSLKERFDMDYDDGKDGNFLKEWKSQVEEQAKINKSFFENVEDPELLKDLQGYRPGSYLRVEINHIPWEFMENFDPQKNCPIIIGSLDSANQKTLAIIQARVKKHRWHPKILKTRDPLIVSLGWRRFQTISLYSVQDHNMRNRLVKYTPEHLHCIANFFGPMTPQGTGILGIAPQNFEGFRITMTGTILDMSKSSELVKKLKLIGHPQKIFKKSAFINGMFSSQLEVAKFVGAKVKSVSGVRGVIKKPLRAPPGAFRATFEDKILSSDIIFCRTWAKVEIPNFFLNLPTHIIPQPRVVKTLGQLKREKGIQAQVNPDHLYEPIERTVKEFKPLKVPKALQDRLPYKDKPKVKAKINAPKRIAVIKEPHERKMAKFMKALKTRFNEKEAQEKEFKDKRTAERAKVMKKLEEKQNRRTKELRKKVFKTLGQMKPKGDAVGGGGGKRGGKFSKFNKKR